MIFSILFFKIFLFLIMIAELIPSFIALFPCQKKKRKSFLPISIILPTKNEEKIINKIIRSWIKINYPGKKELIFCDHSEDNTPRKIKKWAKQYSYIRYIRTDTGSKLGNILMGVKAAKYPWIAINDADIIPSRNSTRKIAEFLTKKTGAVFGKVIPQKTKTLFEILTGFEQVQKSISQKCYSNIDSAPYLSLANCLVRKKDIINISPKNLIADDAYLAVKLRRKGLKCLFIPQGSSQEKYARSFKGLFKKRFRISQGSSQVALKEYLDVLKSKKNYKLFKWAVIPLRELYFLGFDLLLLFFTIALIVEKIFSIIRWETAIILMGGIYTALFLTHFFQASFVMPYALRYKNKKFIYASPLYPIYYVIFFRIISTVSLVYYLFQRVFLNKKLKVKSYWR